MKSRTQSMRIRCAAFGLLLILCAQDVLSKDAVSTLAQTASPELIGELTKSLSITPAQASGGAGALFGLAKSRMSSADFSKVAACVPGMDSLIQSAPAASAGGGIPGLSGIESALPGKLGGLASVAGSFKQLGLSPSMATKFVPVLTSFVQVKGGSSVGSLLSGALK